MDINLLVHYYSFIFLFNLAVNYVYIHHAFFVFGRNFYSNDPYNISAYLLYIFRT